jgi:acetate kinase
MAGMTVPSRVLVLNAGSSSLKWSVLLRTATTPIASGTTDWSNTPTAARAEQLLRILAEAPSFDAVGHRVVHGGMDFRDSVRIDAATRQVLAAVTDLDPTHMPATLAAIDAVSAAFPHLPQVAAFDTAFHATMPEAAAGYALPYEWTTRYGIRRFGFHGLSVDYAVTRVAFLAGALPSRIVVCHLGGGCSVTAVAGGRSVDTTMGFSPLEGMMMSTRSGNVDPGLLLHLQLRHGLTPATLHETLVARSGLLGVSGVSGDLRVVIDAMVRGEARATLAYERFVLSVRRAIGQMSGVLGGIDALVFTGGIGESSARVRADAATAASGARLAEGPTDVSADRSDRDISSADSAVRVFVLRAREDLVIRREVLRHCGYQDTAQDQGLV